MSSTVVETSLNFIEQIIEADLKSVKHSNIHTRFARAQWFSTN